MGGFNFTFTTYVLYVCLSIGVGFVNAGYDENACYHCQDTVPDGECQNYKSLKKANENQDDEDQPLLRNCTVDQHYCMIEVFIIQGSLYSYIRGCASDKGKSFSFLQEGRLKSLKPDNITTCSFDKRTKGQICETLCQGKICNGPQSRGEDVKPALLVCLIACVVTTFLRIKGLTCYRCASTITNSQCNELYKVDEDNIGQHFSTNCTDRQPFCVIESYTTHNISRNLYSIIRDCSDNRTYSYNMSNPQAKHLRPDTTYVKLNKTKTTIGFDAFFDVHILLCDQDYCNGPLVVSSEGQRSKSSVFALGWILCLGIFLR